MKYAILKSFPYSHDGIHPVMLVEGGEPQEIRDDVAGGLVAAGYLGRPSERAVAPMPESTPVLAAPETSVTAPHENKYSRDNESQRDRRRR